MGRLDVERRVLGACGKFGALLRHVALDVREDGFELGFVADGGEIRVEVAVVAPIGSAPSIGLSFAKLSECLRLIAAQGLDLDICDTEAGYAQPDVTTNCYFAQFQQSTRRSGLAASLQYQCQVNSRAVVAHVDLGRRGREQLWKQMSISLSRGVVIASLQIRVAHDCQRAASRSGAVDTTFRARFACSIARFGWPR